jgi:formylglycine-generating enzyme required for sulfatase activity
LMGQNIEFLMGQDAKKTRETKIVTLSHRFAVATHEVTVAQFQKFSSDHKYNAKLAPKQDCPVNKVSWYDAVKYCNRLSKEEGIPEDQWCYEPNDKGDYAEGMKIPVNYLERTGYRLPTEEEWEFVCRANSTSTYGFGEPLELLASYSWHLNNAESHMWPVGVKLPNALGVFDMHGNVVEWCHNLSYSTDQSRPADVAVKDADSRVRRGGWSTAQIFYVRSESRGSMKPLHRFKTHGFRPARTYPLSPLSPTAKEGRN